MSNAQTTREAAYRPPLPPRWKGSDSVTMVHEFNARCLTALGAWAKESVQCDLSVIEQHRALWSQLDGLSIQRAAQLPFVILTVRFTDGTCADVEAIITCSGYTPVFPFLHASVPTGTVSTGLP